MFKKRARVFVDPKVQGAMLRRSVMYWLWGSILFALIIFFYRIAPAYFLDTHTDPGFWFHFGPVVIASLVLLPVVMLNTIRFSNRFVGPMVRLRGALSQLARGEPIEPISFRGDDFWTEVATDFNSVANRLREAKKDRSLHGQVETSVNPSGSDQVLEATRR